MDTLPIELLNNIFCQLFYEDVYSFLQINYQFYEIFNLHKKRLAKEYLQNYVKEHQDPFTKQAIFFETKHKCKDCMPSYSFIINNNNYASLILHDNSLILSDLTCSQCYKKNNFIIVFNAHSRTHKNINNILFGDITKNIRERIKKECEKVMFDKIVSILRVFVNL